MANQVKPIPEGYHSITPHLMVDGAANFAEFLKRAFGAVEEGRMAGPGGKIMHAEMKIGDSKLMFGDYFPEFGCPPIPVSKWPFVLHVYVPDADKVFAKAVAEGCEATMPLGDQFWGDRYGQVKDPFGFVWAIATRKEILTPDEIMKRHDEAFAARK